MSCPICGKPKDVEFKGTDCCLDLCEMKGRIPEEERLTAVSRLKGYADDLTNRMFAAAAKLRDGETR